MAGMTPAVRAAILAIVAFLAACTTGSTEPEEGGERWNPDETATDSRRGVDLSISYDPATQRFYGSVTNTTTTAVADVRVDQGKKLRKVLTELYANTVS